MSAFLRLPLPCTFYFEQHNCMSQMGLFLQVTEELKQCHNYICGYALM